MCLCVEKEAKHKVWILGFFQTSQGAYLATSLLFLSATRNHFMYQQFMCKYQQQFRHLPLSFQQCWLCKEQSKVSRNPGSPILSPGKSFCSQGTIKSLFACLVCVPNAQCLSFSEPKENRRWHEVSTFSLMNWTAQPEIQVLNFQH